MFESNYFIMLMKPSYEKPVDTAQDVIDKGLTIIFGPGMESELERQKNSASAVNRALAGLTIVSKVIFCVLDKFSILILNFPDRIRMGLTIWNGVPRQLRRAPLFS